MKKNSKVIKMRKNTGLEQLKEKLAQLSITLDEMDRKTDLSTGFLKKMSLYDDEYEEEEDEEDFHFGLVRLGLLIMSFPAFLSTISSLLVLFQ